MKSFLIILLPVALGLATSGTNVRGKLNIYSLVDYTAPYVKSDQNQQLRAEYGETSLTPIGPIIYPPIGPYVDPIYPLVYRKSLYKTQPQSYVPYLGKNSQPLDIYDVYHNPVVVLIKNRPDADEVEAYFLDHGLSSVVDSPHARIIHDVLKSGGEYNAIAFRASSLHDLQLHLLKDLKVQKVEYPPGTKFSSFTRWYNCDVPFVYLHPKDDWSVFDKEVILRIGVIDVTNENVWLKVD